MGSNAGEPIPTTRHDLGDIGEGLYVVDVRRFAENSHLGREWRTEPRHGALAFDGLHQRGFLAGHVGVTRQGDLHIEGEIGTQDVLAQKPKFVSLTDDGARAIDGLVMAMANEDVTPVGVASVARDGDALDDRGGIALEDAAIIEGAGVSLLAVAKDVLVGIRITGQEPPLDAGRERRTTSTTEAGCSNLAESVFGRHLGEGFVQGRVPTVGDVLVEIGRIYVAGVAQGDTLLQSHHRVVCKVRDAWRRLGVVPKVANGVFGQGRPTGHMLTHDAVCQFRSGPTVKHPGAIGHLHVQQRLGETQAKGPDFRDVGCHLLLFQGGVDGGDDLKPASSFASQSGADADPWPVAGGQVFPPEAGFGEDADKRRFRWRGHGATRGSVSRSGCEGIGDSRTGALGSDPPSQVMVDRHDRSMGTGSQASVVAQGGLAVGGVALVGEFQRILRRRDHRGCSHDVAGWAPADLNAEISRRDEAEIRIEGGNRPHVVDGSIHTRRDSLDGLSRDVSDGVFHRQQRRKDGDRTLRLVVDRPINQLEGGIVHL